MRSIKSLLVMCLALCMLLLPLTGCGKSQSKYTHSYFEYFDTYSTLTLYAESEASAEALFDKAEALLTKWHRLLDRHKTYEGVTNLATLNERAGSETVPVSPELFAFLSFAKEAFSLTEGQTNAALGSVLALWQTEREAAKNHPDQAKLPETTAITEAMIHTDISALVLQEEPHAVSFADPYLSLDGGALAKGYVAERLRELLLSEGCTDFLINLGGNLLGVGAHPDGTPWRCALENPTEGKGGFDGTVRLCGMSLVTTGSYHRFYTVAGKDYCHVIDPDTGMPPDRFLSVSVLCPDSARADALSTALFCMTYEEGLALIRSLPDTEALWILPDGSLRESEGFAAHTEV